MTKVSVLIDTFNHEKYIHHAIKSVLKQERLGNTAVDIVVIDDGSTDRTGEIVQSFGSVLRYYYKPNGGQASAFNLGIPLCQGEVICFLDGDDWWHPNKLSAVLDAFSKTPALCAVGHSFWEVDEVSGGSFKVGPEANTPIQFDTSESTALFHQFACCLGTSRLAVKRSAAVALLDIPEPLIFEADEYIFSLVPTIGQVVILAEPLTYYRIHGGNLYQDSRAAAATYETDVRLRRRASIFKCLNEQLPIELQRRGLDSASTQFLLGPVRVQASRLHLMTSGGTSLENFRSERLAAKILGRNRSMFGSIVLWTSLAFTLVLSPRRYFRLRQWYSNLLRRFQR